MTQAFNLSQFANNVNSAGVAQTGGGGTGTNIASNDLTVNGLTVGKGGGSVSNNTVLGLQAGYTNSSGSRNTFIGYSAGYSNTTGLANTFIGGPEATGGNSAGYSNTTGSYNTSLGDGALGQNTTASKQTAVGYQAGYGATTIGDQTAVGYQALYTGGGGGDVAVGEAALYSGTSAGGANTALGYFAAYSTTSGANNTALGREALRSNTTASNNTAVGYQAGYGITTGGNNIFIGKGAGSNITTQTDCIFIGPSTVGSGASIEIVIGAGSPTGKGIYTGYIYPAGGGVYQGNNSATWSITSDARLKKNIVDNTDGLNAINAIQVRNFEYRTKDEVTELASQNAIDIKGVQLGAIAQELQAILPDCVKTESTGVMSIDASNITWYLINAVKELNAKITALENK